jgi:iron(III) transport system permease protein
MGGLLSGKRVTLWAAVAVWIGVGVIPLCVMLATSLSSTQNYTATLGSARTWGLFRNSLLLATLTTAVAGAVGVTLGVILAKTDLALRNTLAAIFSLPLLFPPYILAVGWFEVLGRSGILAHFGGAAVGEATGRWLFGLPGLVLVLSTAFLPVVLLLTLTYVRAVNTNLEDAARLSSSRATVLRRITIPLAAPGILLSLILVFLLAMGEFGAPAFLRFDAFPVASFTQFTAFYNFGAATAAATPLVLVVLMGLALEQRVLHGKAFQFGWNVRSSGGQIPLRSARTLLGLTVVFTALIVVVVPLSALMWRGMNVAALREALDRAGNSAVRSVAYAAASATILSVLGFFLAYLIHRRAIPGWRWVDAGTLFLFTLPGTVIGLGLIGLWNRPSTNWIYATPAMLTGGYIAQYAVLGTRAMVAGFAQTPVHLEEAAEIAGAAWFQRVRGILMPLLWPSILVGWAVTFLFCLRDVTLPLLLAPPGYDTLTARTMTLAANGSPELIAALCLLLISLSMIPLGVCGLARRFWSTAK